MIIDTDKVNFHCYSCSKTLDIDFKSEKVAIVPMCEECLETLKEEISKETGEMEWIRGYNKGMSDGIEIDKSEEGL